jgi:hypothetical protein
MRTRSRHRPPYSVVIALETAIAVVLYAASPRRDQYPAVVAAVLCFAAVPLAFPRSRPRRRTLICPVNFTLALFFVQLVALPLLLVYDGPLRGELPFLPSFRAVNVAILLSCLAYTAFCVTYHLAASSSRCSARRSVEYTWKRPDLELIGLFALVGIVGMVCAFHTPRGLIDYFDKDGATVPGATQLAQGSGLVWNLGLVLRPFLGFAIVLLWCNWLDSTHAQSRTRVKAVALTVAAAAGVTFVYATYSYNRSAFVVPLLAMLGVFTTRVFRVRLVALVVIAAVGFVGLAAYHTYRQSPFTITQALTSRSGTIIKNTHVNEELQSYAAGPQYVGFLLQQTDYAHKLHFGTTIVSSLLDPLPKLGAPFRPSSGTQLYNHLIYGVRGTADQTLPFQGELFINFNVLGVLLGYVVLALGIHAAQRRLDSAATSTERFVWQYSGIWLGFLVVSSVSVISQIFIYFFWPAYVLVYLVGSGRLRPGTSEAATRSLTRLGLAGDER